MILYNSCMRKGLMLLTKCCGCALVMCNIIIAIDLGYTSGEGGNKCRQYLMTSCDKMTRCVLKLSLTGKSNNNYQKQPKHVFSGASFVVFMCANRTAY